MWSRQAPSGGPGKEPDLPYVKRRGQPRRASVERAPLSLAWKFLLEHGTYPPAALIGPGDDKIDLFRSWGRDSRWAEPVWRTHRETILFDWAAAGRRGPCWAEWVFDLGLSGGGLFFRLDGNYSHFPTTGVGSVRRDVISAGRVAGARCRGVASAACVASSR
jgi:hypothetical protein